MLSFSSTISPLPSLLFYLLFLIFRLLEKSSYGRKTVCSLALLVSRDLSCKKSLQAVRFILFFGVVIGKGEK